jgi:hypothetical protein
MRTYPSQLRGVDPTQNPIPRDSAALQKVLAILADLDFAHGCELERIATGSGDVALKERLRSRSEAQHHERRDPYVRQLGRLEARIRAEMPDVRQSPLDLDAA